MSVPSLSIFRDSGLIHDEQKLVPVRTGMGTNRQTAGQSPSTDHKWCAINTMERQGGWGLPKRRLEGD